MVKFVIAALLAASVIGAVIPAQAGTTCTTYGNQTYCSDTNGNTRTCTRYGNQVYCN